MNFIKNYFIFAIAILSIINSPVSFGKNTNLDYPSIPEEAKIDFNILPSFKAKAKRNAGFESNITWDTDQTKKKEYYAEGTGTRGSGSGILTLLADNTYALTLLDIYKSERPQEFPGFYNPDPKLIELNDKQIDSEIAAELIYKQVFKRINYVFPVLADLLEQAEITIAKEKWTASASEFPLIEDFGDKPLLSQNQKQVQIAYRLTNQIIYNEKLYQLMNPFNRAALKLHEYVYAVSNLKESLPIQKVISFFMSDQFNESNFKETAKELMNQELLRPLSIPNLKVPNGMEISEASPSSNEICGLMSYMDLNLNGILTLKVKIFENKFQLTHNDFLLPKSQKIEDQLKNIGRFGRTLEKEFQISDKNDIIRILTSFYYVKANFAKKFPIYLYPAQKTPADIICFNGEKSSFIPSSIAMAVEYHEEKNKLELETAKLEADYFRSQREYLKGLTEIHFESHKNNASLNALALKIKESKDLLKDKLDQLNSYKAMNMLTIVQNGKMLEMIKLNFK